MKHSMWLKLPLLVLGTGAVLLLPPACKAQSEISPDHFDGTDSWAVASHTVHAPVQKQAVATASLPAKNAKTSQASAFQLASAREATKAANGDVLAIDRKRMAPARKHEKQ